jgi:hypothetical protein
VSASTVRGNCRRTSSRASNSSRPLPAAVAAGAKRVAVSQAVCQADDPRRRRRAGANPQCGPGWGPIADCVEDFAPVRGGASRPTPGRILAVISSRLADKRTCRAEERWRTLATHSHFRLSIR